MVFHTCRFGSVQSDNAVLAIKESETVTSGAQPCARANHAIASRIALCEMMSCTPCISQVSYVDDPGLLGSHIPESHRAPTCTRMARPIVSTICGTTSRAPLGPSTAAHHCRRAPPFASSRLSTTPPFWPSVVYCPAYGWQPVAANCLWEGHHEDLTSHGRDAAASFGSS